MKQKVTDPETIQCRPSIYVVTVCQDGKVVEQQQFYFVNEAYIFARDKRAEGYRTEQSTIPNPEFRGAIQLSGNTYHKPHKRHTASNGRKEWAQKVLCITTGVEFPTVRDCEKAVGISGYRIRCSILRGKTVDGLRFEYI